MCLLAFQLNHSVYKLVMMANRDEAYERPTAAAGFWSDDPNILAGRDLEQMGTWLGVNKQGKIAALTNYRDFSMPAAGKRSRGHIVSSYLQSAVPAGQFMGALHEKRNDYTGFNVLAGTPEELFYYSNIEQCVKRLTSGTHGLSNALLDSPWPKLEKTKRLLHDYMQRTEEIDPDVLFGFMQQEERFPQEQLPDTGVGAELESLLSSIFIASENYGTRCTTVVAVDRRDHLYFEERIYNKGIYAASNVFEFDIERAE